jgi:hypothetical protein
MPPNKTRSVHKKMLGRYFDAELARRLQAMAAQGCPNGSGAMESFCSQLQGRFKRCGQFWGSAGMADLLALDVARRNFDWDALWLQN